MVIGKSPVGSQFFFAPFYAARPRDEGSISNNAAVANEKPSRLLDFLESVLKFHFGRGSRGSHGKTPGKIRALREIRVPKRKDGALIKVVGQIANLPGAI
ncbi:MAG: hypothetical protein QY329_07150 [Anaerolineales bacterium]|nr:MAG: hypothetical protein QY329_07150 [Anaerolineales bacterium]